MEERKEGRRGRKGLEVVIGMIVISLMMMSGEGLVSKHKIVDDVRPAFFVENFGFEGDGHLLLNVSHFLVLFLFIFSRPLPVYTINLL